MELSPCPGALLALLAAVLAHCGAAAVDLEDSDMVPAAAGKLSDNEDDRRIRQYGKQCTYISAAGPKFHSLLSWRWYV